MSRLTDGLSNHDFTFALYQRVECDLGEGQVLGRSKFGYPDGIYLIQFEDDSQAWVETTWLRAVETDTNNN